MDARLTFDGGGLAALASCEDPAVAAARSYATADIKHECASAVLDAIHAAFEADLGPAPSALILTDDECGTLVFPGSHPRLIRPLRWAWAEGRGQDDRVQIWTAETLAFALDNGVSLFGKGGTTPRRFTRWRALLPQAIEFDRRYAEAANRHGLDVAREARQAAYRDKCRAERVLNASVASSLNGLAALVQHIGTFGIDQMPSAWLALFVSAANVCGVATGVPPFDVARWELELAAVGGRAYPPSDHCSARVSFPVYYGEDERISIISRLSEQYEENKLAVRLHLEKMGAQA